MDYEKMWKELKDKMVSLTPSYGELNKHGVLRFMEQIEHNSKK
ncbi:hypothetical protein [Bacillus sp. T33-2]|nr:hypothetical protein [Bacillus sp. T33-2]